ncbi:MAG: helix-turn-helix domain-containing protein [Candidatus Tritonobacter lacicola]|nr:helix-turn-helix domain-containing protein [Candidatus Tritonobacter lacicola]
MTEEREAERLLTAKQLANKLQISERQVRRLYQKSKIPGFKISYRCLRFDLDEVLGALKKNV